MWKLHKILKIYLIICKGRCGIELNIGWYIYVVGGWHFDCSILCRDQWLWKVYSYPNLDEPEWVGRMRATVYCQHKGDLCSFLLFSIFHLFSYKSSQGENINYFLPVLNIFIQEESLNSYKFQLTLTIKSLQPEDFGTYRCISKNSIGQAEEVVELYGETLPRGMSASHSELGTRGLQ